VFSNFYLHTKLQYDRINYIFVRLKADALIYRTKPKKQQRVMKKTTKQLEMWANAQPDGRPAKYRWRPLFNAAKFG